MEALAALADPTRRRIVELLAERPRRAGDLAEEFDVSRPAVSRHLRVLREVGLVSVEARAQERIYRLDGGSLAAIDDWFAQLRPFWSNRLDALGTELRRAHRRGPP